MTTRLEKIERKQAMLEEQLLSSQDNPRKRKKRRVKTFKLPFKAKSTLKKSSKSPEYVVTQYLTQKKDIKFMMCRVISGNIIIVNNKVHKLNPKYLWRYGKNFWYIHREIDREPVSNEDYEIIKNSHRDTESDVPLIKAVLGAVNKPSKVVGGAKIGLIILGLLLLGGIAIAIF